ncbi:transmembrane protein 246 [Megalops cyprinoides]|uniref:transmembrane protein 246 n=1 Tax=Megalops cyprinoides TaxID=118141 RepID=UPI001863C729|nr:transmembrane protein 246 [Megalops cyprinoides]
MPRWKVFVRRHLQWSSPIFQGLALCLLTFAIVLPLFCHRLLYSYYFIKPFYLDSMSDEVLEESYRRGQEALHFWKDPISDQPPGFTNMAGQRRPELLVTVVTARRTEGKDYHYLLQVMQRLVSLLATCGGQGCAELLVCDVESGLQENEDASLLEKRFRVVRSSREESGRGKAYINTFEKEKRDYVYCLKKGWELVQPKNVVVLEDDALPMVDFFPVINNLLSRKFSSRTLYVKLYHPERLQRYWNPEPYRILEWVGLGLLGGTALLWAHSFCTSYSSSAAHMVFFTLYIMAAAELIGRHYLLEVRRFSPQLYAVSPATECCTPAMLFPGNASLRVAEYLDQVFCVKGKAKDMALYQIARSMRGERAHSLEPNLITHIGAFSSVRANPSHPRLL